MDVIKFYKVKNEYYGCFSNFSRHSFILKGKEWKTSEHYYQAMKFEGTEHEERIRLLETPREAFNEGNRKDLPLRKDWEKVKQQVMYEAVFAKFSQNAVIRDILLSTGMSKIVEDSPIDSYWGIGADGNGRNVLGYILMIVRDYFFNNSDKRKVGLYGKFKVERTDGSSAPGGKHENCKYFVLDIDHDAFAIPALEAYANACSQEYPILAKNLKELINSKKVDIKE